MVLSLGETPVNVSRQNTCPSKTCTTLNIFCKQTGSCYSFTSECLSIAIKFLVLCISLKLNARHRRKKCTDKYFELVFKDIKFTSLFCRLITFTKFLHKKSRLDVQKNAFSGDGAKIWNEMPNSLKKKHIKEDLNSSFIKHTENRRQLNR